MVERCFFFRIYTKGSTIFIHTLIPNTLKQILIPQTTLLITINTTAHSTPNGPFQLRVKIKLAMILIFFVLYLEGLIPAIYFNKGRHPYPPLLFGAIVTLERWGLGQVVLKRQDLCYFHKLVCFCAETGKK